MSDTFTHPTIGDTLSCGHVLTQAMKADAGIGTGYARTMPDNQTLCYSCADTDQRREFAASTTFGAYVSQFGNLTTWTGGVLAMGFTQRHGVSRNGWHGSEIHSWRFYANDGSEWYGRNAGPGSCITVRRAK